MLTFVLRRVLYSIPVLILASILVFGFVRSTTDPLARLRQSQDKTLLERERHRIGLDKPLYVQYFTQMGNIVTGNWGESFISRRSVGAEVRDKLWNTVQLIFFGVLVSFIVAIAIGVYSAVRQYSLLDYTFTGLSFVGLSMPPFWFGLIAIEVFSFRLKSWLHLSEPVFYSVGIGNGGPVIYLRHLVLPLATLVVQIIAVWSRYERASMLDAMSSDYIRTAKAKGLPRRKVVLKHGLRNALIPLVTVSAIDIGVLFGGLIVTEQIFSWPGMGRLFLESLLNGDTAVLLPWLLVTAVFIIAFNLLADVLYGVLDPRIRLG